MTFCCFFFFFQAEDGIRDLIVTGVQTCALPICGGPMLPPAGLRWWPGTWLRLLIWKWKLGGKVEPAERRGYWFWIPTVVTILVIELLGALSRTFNNAIPWPTISGTIGHLEKRWDWVAIIVVGLITIVAFHA